ncbi:NADPH-dependent oxidoreductase [Niallia circulans]|uniref:NADPH-dependent oxidoreductase n=1 Tax=Niallia circulans TaxID=1397 RepID=A0A553SF55_NIACI|nr:NAD(P)H-dependent oxidoreductase [Niallia circulans]TRZ35614.1 NADPH-dependent oxidoreductase [Niallia circulans]
MKLVGVSGSLVGSKTAKAVNKVLSAAKLADAAIETELVDLKEYDVEFVKGTELSNYNEDTIKVVETILAADLLIIGSPVYQASIPGALKNLFDHLPVDAFQGKVTGIIMTAGTDKHFLVAEHQLKPILSYLKGLIPSSAVFVHNDDFNEDNDISSKEVGARINNLANEMLILQNSIS